MGRLFVRVLAVGGLGLLLLAWPATSVYAHGFGQRYDLPVPLGLYVAGSGAAVALSFVVIGLFVRGAPGLREYPRVNRAALAGAGARGWTRAMRAAVLLVAGRGGGRVRAGGRGGAVRGRRADEEPCADGGVGDLVGGTGVRLGSGGGRVGAGEPVEDAVRVGGGGRAGGCGRGRSCRCGGRTPPSGARGRGWHAVRLLRMGGAGVFGRGRAGADRADGAGVLGGHVGGDGGVRQGGVAAERGGVFAGVRVPGAVCADGGPGGGGAAGGVPATLRCGAASERGCVDVDDGVRRAAAGDRDVRRADGDAGVGGGVGGDRGGGVGARRRWGPWGWWRCRCCSWGCTRAPAR